LVFRRPLPICPCGGPAERTVATPSAESDSRDKIRKVLEQFQTLLLEWVPGAASASKGSRPVRDSAGALLKVIEDSWVQQPDGSYAVGGQVLMQQAAQRLLEAIRIAKYGNLLPDSIEAVYFGVQPPDFWPALQAERRRRATSEWQSGQLAWMRKAAELPRGLEGELERVWDILRIDPSQCRLRPSVNGTGFFVPYVDHLCFPVSVEGSDYRILIEVLRDLSEQGFRQTEEATAERRPEDAIRHAGQHLLKTVCRHFVLKPDGWYHPWGAFDLQRSVGLLLKTV
jgi:hypothetical protein